MTKQEIITRMQEEKVVAIARGLNETQAVKAAEALYEGGIRFMEVTFDASGKTTDEQTGRIIAAVIAAMQGRMFIGAGTVLTAQQVEIAKAAGGEFIISPDTNEVVIRRTCELGMVSIPGAMTPSEAMAAHRYGADFVKIFPSGTLGASYIRAIRAPLSNLRLMAVGGVSEKNLAEFLAAGCEGAGIGGNLVSKAAVERGDYYVLTKTAKCVLAAARG